ncbi:hypothetical protein V501_03295 [Pseudogymnoascus sp. VKM F-4519 (FW-2642)]|nr:hypothetical protein V501_03295 [Pseudogymnoascus sp. VKM F-4519 (FW-2642)]
MTQPITEVVQLQLQPGAVIEELMSDFLRILQRQPGFQHLAWGRWEESPDNVQLLLNWDTIEAHRQFELSGADFAAVGEVLGPVLAKPPAMHHVNFKPAIADIISSAGTV